MSGTSPAPRASRKPTRRPGRGRRPSREWPGGVRPTGLLIALSTYLAALPVILIASLFWLWPAFEQAQEGAASAEVPAAVATNSPSPASSSSPAPSSASPSASPTPAPSASAPSVRSVPTSEATVNLFGRTLKVTFTTGSSLLALSVLAGALGTCIYLVQSFVTFVGNRTLSSSWSLWYLLRPAQGGALAAALYFVLRAGVQGGPGISAPGNLYGVAALSVLTGMFVSNAIDKLRDIFDVAFASRPGMGDDERSGKPDERPPLEATSIDPRTVTTGTAPVEVELTGSGFDTTTVVRVDGNDRTTRLVSPMRLRVALVPDDTRSAGTRRLMAVSDNGEISNEMELEVT
jgi:hypothetical protein